VTDAADVNVCRENVCIHINETSEQLTNGDHRLSYARTCNETSYTQYTCTTVSVLTLSIYCKIIQKQKYR